MEDEKKQRLLDFADEVINARRMFPKMYEEVIGKTVAKELKKLVSSLFHINQNYEQHLTLPGNDKCKDDAR